MEKKDDLVMVDFKGFVKQLPDGQWQASLQITAGAHSYMCNVQELFNDRESAVDYLEKNSERITEVFCEKLGMVPQPRQRNQANKAIH